MKIDFSMLDSLADQIEKQTGESICAEDVALSQWTLKDFRWHLAQYISGVLVPADMECLGNRIYRVRQQQGAQREIIVVDCGDYRAFYDCSEVRSFE